MCVLLRKITEVILNYIFRLITKITNLFEKQFPYLKNHYGVILTDLQMTLLREADLLVAVNQSFHKLKTDNFCVITKSVVLIVRSIT